VPSLAATHRRKGADVAKFERIKTDPGRIHDPAGAYAHGIRTGNLLFVAGQVAMNTEGRIVHANDPKGQFRLILDNIITVVEAAGGTKDDIVKLLAFMENMDHLQDFQDVLNEYFTEGYPTVTLVEVSRLAVKDMLMECEATAVLD
jgi:reactive intermediate/imine deaminase